MKNEDKIVELLSEMLLRQDRFESRLDKLTEAMDKLATGLDQLGTGLDLLANSQERLITIQERQEKILIKILEVLADDVLKFDELIEMDQLGGKKVVPRKTK